MKLSFTAAIAICSLGLVVWFCLLAATASTTTPAAPKQIPNRTEPRVTTPTATEGPSSDPAVPGTARRVTPHVTEPASEESFAAAMHELERSDPARALEMARQALSRWPHSERAAEFARTEVKCLYLLGRPSEGRGAAEAMVNKYLGTPWALEVERETGAHPYVNH